MPDPDDMPDEGGWGAADRRHRSANDLMVSQRLENISAAVRDLKRDLERLRDVVSKDVESGAERTFMIRRVEERLNDLYTRFLTVEANYVRASEHEKALAPFKKWGSWIAMLVIGGVVTAVMALVLNKGTLH